MANIDRSESLRILSLDGGGIKGYTTLLILRRIMRTLSQEAGDANGEIRPCDVFDLIIGTSTGGLIAVMLGRLRMAVDQCITAYEKVGGRVFRRATPFGSFGKVVRGATSSALYSIDMLQEEIRDILTKQGLEADVPFREDEDQPCKVALCVTRTLTAKPDVLRSYRATASTAENYDCTVWEAASATAAAPIYFKPVRFAHGGVQFSDGGLHRNNPVNEALTEVLQIPALKERRIGCLISVGTGLSKITSVPKNLTSFLAKAVEMLTDSERIADDFALSRTGQQLVEEDRYFRFNVPQGLEDLKLDDHKEIERMEALTTLYLSKAGSGREIDRCVKSLLNPDRSNKTNVDDIPSLLPRQNREHFVRREEYHKALQNFFCRETSYRRVFVLWGMGGAGSQIALDFAISIRTTMPVFWMRADKLTNFATDLDAVARAIRPTQGESPSNDVPSMDSLKHIQRLLERHSSRYLLVLDNAEKLDDFCSTDDRTQAIRTYIPSNASVLLTTRDPGYQGGYASSKNGLHVQPMHAIEAATLLFKSVPDHLADSVTNETADDVRELLEALGYLPLAVAQAAANMRELQISIAQFSRDFREKERRLGLMQIPVLNVDNPDPRAETQSIGLTWEMSFEVLVQKQPLSIACLNYMAFLDHRGVPHDLLMKLPGLKEVDAVSQQSAVSALLRLSLITQTSSNPDFRGYAIHPVIQERIMCRLSADEAQISATVVGSLICAMISDAEDGSDLPGTDRAIATCFMPHALSCIKATRLLSRHSIVLCALMHSVARFLKQMGYTGIAVKLASQCMDEALEVWQWNDLNVFWTLMTRLDCLVGDEQGELILWLCDSVGDAILSSELIKTQIDSVELDVLWVCLLNFRARAMSDLERYEEQLFLSPLQLALARKLWPSDIEVIAKYNFNRANLLNNLGRFEEAETICDQQINEFDTAEGTAAGTYLKVCMLREKAQCLHNRAVSQIHMPSASLALAQEGLSISLRACNLAMTLGIKHPCPWACVGETFTRLVRVHRSVEAVELGLELLQAANDQTPHFEGHLLTHVQCSLASIESVLSHPAFASTSGSRRLQKLMHDLQKMYDNSLTMNVQTMPVGRLNRHAVEVLDRGRLQEAEAMFRRALNLCRRQNLQSWSVLHYNLMLAIARHPGRLEEALEYRRLHSTLISVHERDCGTLESRLAMDKDDRWIYHQAQKHYRSKGKGKSVLTEAHADGLFRAMARYGPLEGPMFQLEGVGMDAQEGLRSSLGQTANCIKRAIHLPKPLQKNN